MLGVSANAAAAMAYRAREKLRQSYLQAHLLASPAPEHEPYRSQLGAYVRDGLSKRDHAAVAAHLEGCESCRDLVAELDDVNRMLARSVVPLFLLAGAKLPVGAVVAGGAAAVGGGSTGVFGRLKQLGPTLGSAAAITAVVAGLAGLGGVMAREDGPVDVAADAADIGSSSPAGDDRDNGDSGDDRGDDGDSTTTSLFGDDDFAMSEFDDDHRRTVRLRLRRRRLPVAVRPEVPHRVQLGRVPRTVRPRTTAPTTAPVRPRRPAGAVHAPAVDPAPGPHRSPGPRPPMPPPLSFTASSWTPSAVGRGQLSLTIGEPGVPALMTAGAFSTPASGSEVLTPAPVGPDDPGAAEAPGRADRRRPRPPRGRARPPVHPGRTGRRVHADAAGHRAPPTRSASTSRSTPPARPPRSCCSGATPSRPSSRRPSRCPRTRTGWRSPSPSGPTTRSSASPSRSGGCPSAPPPPATTTVSGATIRITANQDAGLLPAAVFSNLVHDEFLELLPPQLRGQVLQDVLGPLPAGCAVEGWTAPPGGTPVARDPAGRAADDDRLPGPRPGTRGRAGHLRRVRGGRFPDLRRRRRCHRGRHRSP